jgi:hypothetical protein
MSAEATTVLLLNTHTTSYNCKENCIKSCSLLTHIYVRNAYGMTRNYVNPKGLNDDYDDNNNNNNNNHYIRHFFFHLSSSLSKG